MAKVKELFLTLFLALTIFLLPFCMAVVPYGASVTEEKTETAIADAPSSDAAIAGNVTELTVSGFSTTQTWQGYFGNVTGTIQLADASDNVMYNWSLADPEGEIYATINDTIIWTNIQCFNFTASGAGGDESSTRGGTSLLGMNLTTLEGLYGLASNDVDGVDETFSASNSYDLFYTNNLEFADGECLATSIYDSTGASVTGNFQEVLLYSPESDAIVFTSILEESSVNGFDGGDHDFEMLVLENGRGTDVATTTYYFYVELE